MKHKPPHIYIPIPWPYSQNYLEFEDQIILATGKAYDRFGDSAYFVPQELILKLEGIKPNHPDYTYVLVDEEAFDLRKNIDENLGFKAGINENGSYRFLILAREIDNLNQSLKDDQGPMLEM